MDSIAFPPANFSAPSVSGSDFRFPAPIAFGEESADPDIDFAALMSSLVGDTKVEAVEIGPGVSVTPVDELTSPVPSDDQPELEPSIPPLIAVIIPWTVPTSKLALDISFVSANEDAPSLGERSAPELPREEGRSSVINRVPPGELSFTGRIAPAFETLDNQPATEADNSPAPPVSKTGQPGPPITSKAMVSETASVVTETEPAEKIEHESERAVPASETQQPVPVAPSSSPAPAVSNQPIPANAISAPTSVPPPLHTESKDRTFQVRLGIEDTDIHLRIAERSGELHLAVSANTADAAGRLREGLPDLMNALQSAGHSSEFWKAGPTSSTSSSSREAGEQSFHDDSPSRKQQQQPDQEGGRRRKNRNKDYDPYGVASLA